MASAHADVHFSGTKLLFYQLRAKDLELFFSLFFASIGRGGIIRGKGATLGEKVVRCCPRCFYYKIQLRTVSSFFFRQINTYKHVIGFLNESSDTLWDVERPLDSSKNARQGTP